MTEQRFYVEIVSYNGDEVCERRGPFLERMADRIDDGLNINLNHEKFYTRVAGEAAAPDEKDGA